LIILIYESTDEVAEASLPNYRTGESDITGVTVNESIAIF
jgi:hypothetical protein